MECIICDDAPIASCHSGVQAQPFVDPINAPEEKEFNHAKKGVPFIHYLLCYFDFNLL